MGKISTREEIILRYLENREKLKCDIIYLKIEKSDETRQAVLDLGVIDLVYKYAFYVDECPRDDTRQSACKSPEYAYCYAVCVDKSPRDDTREAACKDPKCAYYYATDVDKSPRQDTRQAAGKDLYWKGRYEVWEESLQEKK